MWHPLVITALIALMAVGVTGNQQSKQSDDHRAEEEARLRDVNEFNRLPKGDNRRWEVLARIARRKEELAIKELRGELARLPEGTHKEAVKAKLANLEKALERFTNTDKYKFGGLGMAKGTFHFDHTFKNPQ